MDLIGKDVLFFIARFKEMAKLRGISGCKYQYFIEGTKTYTEHSEVRGEYSEMIDIYLVYLDKDQQETSKTNSWISPIVDTQNVVQIPRDTPNLERFCRIWLPFGLNGELQPFRITTITLSPKQPIFYTCKLAPEVSVDPTKIDPDYSDDNFNYIEDTR